jgi:hypothetical protein
VLMDNWRPDGKVGGNQTGFWGAISFPSISVKDRSLLVPLVMLNACLTFSWPNKVPFNREVSGIVRAGIYTVARTGAEGGYDEDAKSEPKVRPGCRAVPGYCGSSLSHNIYRDSVLGDL